MKKLSVLLIMMIVMTILLIANPTNIEAESSFPGEQRYLDEYPSTNYVDEELNSLLIYRNMIIKFLLESSEIMTSQNSLEKINEIGQTIFMGHQYYQITNNNQYQEQQPIDLELDDNQQQNNEYIYNYQGVDQNNQLHQGQVAIFDPDNYSLTVSFLDENGEIDEALTKLFIDDSNAETLAYEIVMETQRIYDTDLEPNQASKYYYNCSIEQLAGDISYHAIVCYLAMQMFDKEMVLSYVEVANIANYDSDAKFVNHRY